MCVYMYMCTCVSEQKFSWYVNFMDFAITESYIVSYELMAGYTYY